MLITITPDHLKEYPLHEHEEYEIVCYLYGNGKMQTDCGDFPFQKGTILLIPPRVRHRSVSENGFKNICVHTADRRLSETFVLCGKDNEQCDAQSLAQMLLRAYIDRASGNENVLIGLYNAYRELIKSLLLSSADGRAEAVRRALVSNVENADFNLSGELSAHGASEDHLRVLFKKNYGCTPVQYLTRLRISLACDLFNAYGEKMRVSEVAYASGFNDCLYFSKCFKKLTGQTPKEYKNRRTAEKSAEKTTEKTKQ